MSTPKARTHWLPTYPYAAALYQVLPGVAVQATRDLEQQVGRQMGTAAHPVDWSKPDEWIHERLKGDTRELALRIWKGTQGLVNPRYTAGSLLLARNHGLLQDVGGLYGLTSAGDAFLAGDAEQLRSMDEQEGVTALLVALSGFETASRKEILPAWVEALGGDSRSENTLSGLLYDRMVNAVDRGLVERVSHQRYSLTASGWTAIKQAQPLEVKQRRGLDEAVKAYRGEQRQRLRGLLGQMHPYRFEHLVRDLLMAMEYEDATTTKYSGDKGVDVVATARFGITTVKEVVQVKRVQGSIGSPVINELRGALPLHGALKGTVITLGTFTAAAKESAVHVGAAPITLIDGEELMNLLIRYNVGVTRREVEVFDVNEGLFSADPPDMADTET